MNRPCSAVLLAACLSASPAWADRDQDPWEGVNRKVFAFNEFFDKYAMKPVAKGYQTVTPDRVEQGVGNFFSNLGDVVIFANDALQLKGQKAAGDLARVLLNSTVGVLGIFDVATHAGVQKNDADFGLTLANWGSKPGPYVVLPFLGPSTARDAIGRVPDAMMAPLGEVSDVPARNSLMGLSAVDTRAGLLKAESLITGDKYTFMRDAYLQRRESLVSGGRVKDDFGDENWEE